MFRGKKPKITKNTQNFPVKYIPSMSRRDFVKLLGLGLAGSAVACTPKPIREVIASLTPEPTGTHTSIPTATHTPESTATNTPEPTKTNTPEPTPLYEIPDDAPDYLKAKVEELSNGGLPLKVEVNPSYSKEDEGKSKYMISSKNREGVYETMAFADENTETIRITTAMNEPYKFPSGEMVPSEDGVLINDKQGDKLLEWKDGKWVADKILYLAAGESPKALVGEDDANKNFAQCPYDVNGEAPITGVIKKGIGPADQKSFVAILIDKNTVGFYDPNGYLFQYQIKHDDYYQRINVGVCRYTNGSPLCTINYTWDDASDMLAEWSEEKKTKLIAFEALYEPKDDDFQFVENLTNAIETGTGYPDVFDGTIPVLVLREYSIR
jgi:hypothetical protein